MSEYPKTSLIDIERNYGRSRADLLRMPKPVRQAAAKEIARRATIARTGSRQAVLKITGYVASKRGAKAHLDYIARDGDLALEDDSGGALGRDDWGDILESWAADFSTKGRSGGSPRNVMKMMLSTPSDSDPIKVQEAARAFLEKAFGGRYEYVFALHTDTDNPHVHAAVKLRGHDGRMMRQSRTTLERWRREFASAAREAGIDVDASLRAERGVGKKALSQRDYHALKDGRMLNNLAARTQTAKSATRTDADAAPWELAMKARGLREQGEYAAAARLMRGFAATEKGAVTGAAAAIAKDLESFAQSLPEPLSYREQVKAKDRPRGLQPE